MHWKTSFCQGCWSGNGIDRRPAGSLEFPGPEEDDADGAVYAIHAEDGAAASPPRSRCRAREEDGHARRGCAVTSEAADALYDAESWCLATVTNKRTNGEKEDITAMLEDTDPEATDIRPPTTGRHAPEHFASTSTYLACAAEPFYRPRTSFRQVFERTEGTTSQEEIVARIAARVGKYLHCKGRSLRFPNRGSRVSGQLWTRHSGVQLTYT